MVSTRIGSFQFNSHILKSYAQVKTMLFDYCRAQADTAAGDAVSMDLQMRGKGKKSKRDKKGKTKAKTRKVKAAKTKRQRQRRERQKTKVQNNDKAEHFAG